GCARLRLRLPVVHFTRAITPLAHARARTLPPSPRSSVPFPTSATSLSPNLPGLSVGTVQAQVWQQTGASAFSLVTSAPLTVNDTRGAVPGDTVITPNPVDLATPPATFTITGSGFANLGFGLPVVNFVRGN